MSRYTNYHMRNNVFSELYAPISSLATTIQLKEWQWERRWNNFPILATLENIEEWKVLKREIVKITARNWDYLTVVRWSAQCPPNDDSNVQWSTSFSFNSDDKISLYIPKEIFDNIQDWFTNVHSELDSLFETLDDRNLSLGYNADWYLVTITDYMNNISIVLQRNINDNYVDIQKVWDPKKYRCTYWVNGFLQTIVYDTFN